MVRADALLRQMTVEEKAMQLSSVFPLALFNTEGTNRSQLDALLKNGIGHVSAHERRSADVTRGHQHRQAARS